MSKPIINVDWSIRRSSGFDHTLSRFEYYLRDQGLREATIILYMGNVKRYLTYCNTDHPTLKDWDHFRQSLHDRHLKRSTLNRYSYAAKAYHAMLGESVAVKRLEPHNEIPYYFNEEDIIKLFSVVDNIKHLAMLKLAFYTHLRVSELINLNDEDLNLRDQTVRVREGKGGRAAIISLHPDCIHVLREYLDRRPSIEINGERPLFYTQMANRWQRTEVSRMFDQYKKIACINKPGNLHVFARHSPAFIMLKNGCDLLTIQQLLRHRDIKTTIRYLHVTDQTRRLKHDTFLKL